MLSISHAGFLRTWRTLWLSLAALVYVLPFPRPEAWQGATVGWSPMASVGAVEANDTWDVEGWLRDGAREYHNALRATEEGLWFSLDVMLQDVYEWRDRA